MRATEVALLLLGVLLAVRGDGEPPLLARVLRLQSALLDRQGFRVTHDPNRVRTAVIVEPRRHPYLRAVVQNVMSALGGLWNLHVFGSVEHEAWLRRELRPHEFRVTLLNDTSGSINQLQYSDLLRREQFWERIGTELVLVFQSDTLLLRPPEPHWERYAYAGANYFNRSLLAPASGGVQGGLSLRRRSAMLDCLRRAPLGHVNTYRAAKGQPPVPEEDLLRLEDVYYSHAAEMLGHSMPPPAFRHYFSIETDYHPAPFGLHGWNKPYFTPPQYAELVRSSPALRPFLAEAESAREGPGLMMNMMGGLQGAVAQALPPRVDIRNAAGERPQGGWGGLCAPSSPRMQAPRS